MSKPQKRPNLLIVVADDLGFSDTGPYGSEIATPVLDRLAAEGLRFTDFHTAPACSPTRAMLLSGTDNHIAGVGAMWEDMRGFPDVFTGRQGYEGYLNFRVAALPEVLQDAGYLTLMSGKWHLGMKKELAPCSRGFDKSFVYLAGAGNHFGREPQLDEDIPKLPSLHGEGLYMESDRFLDRSRDLGDDFYSTKSFTDRMIHYLESRTENEMAKPFFGYLAFTAPHWPLQAPREIIQKYKGLYDDGPEGLRARRLRSLIARGIVAADVEAAPLESSAQQWDEMPSLNKSWDEMTASERAESSRLMEIFAAMVDQIDEHLGRLVTYLESTNELDNTFVLFMSDNGAEGALLEAYPILNGKSLADVVAKHYDNSLNNLGRANSFGWYGPRWASAATAPSRGFKQRTTEGGIRCPCILRYPRGITAHPAGSISHTFTNVMDIMPTILDMAGIPVPTSPFHGREVVSMRGKSWVPYLSDPNVRYVYDEKFDFTGWELFGCRAIRQGSWKAVLMHPPKGSGKWELYDLSCDPGELHDLAKSEPEKLQILLRLWETFEQDAGVFDGYLAVQGRKIQSWTRPGAG